MTIERTIKTDAKDVTELTIRSKSHWNYSKKQIEEWREELTITEKYIDENQIFKLVIDKCLIGFYAYQPESETDIKLNYLFVDSKFIGKGYGKALMVDFLQRIKNSEFKRVILDADPHAEKFYSRLGFRVIGKLKSSIKDRFLPIMELEIKPTRNKIYK
ncbi:GNAT family N-acetyltransferase [Maribacter sp.]|uniref:GNAT family N-acetyltransferase n=1 Tax=Maribacter sp. TaxID=1897614 RepID=UPI0025C124E4|nr:GNAT family N-acetyltransferase [Maribacter sp.]